MEESIPFVLSQYDLDPYFFRWYRLGKGHIHATYKVEGPKNFVLQQFNDRVFTRPDVVERNIRLTADYLRKTSPDYLFVSPIRSRNGSDLVYDQQRRPWRLSPFVDNSYSIDEATTRDQAFRAAASFGKFGRLLDRCNVEQFGATIDRFHDLTLRFDQYMDAMTNASSERLEKAADALAMAGRCIHVVEKYNDLVARRIFRQRIFHNDTKVNNVLFDNSTHEVLAVVDLDTLMPGYFIYDLGDLIRTIASPVSEEESDLNKVVFRKDFYDVVVDGYLSEMDSTLTRDEKKHVSFSGQMMTCIMALRFLADFLRGDTYYHTSYAGQNLVRARNQFRLLELLLEHAT